MKSISLEQAGRFIMARQGLIGQRTFTGKQGALDFVRKAGSIQFDPINICGRNPDLTLQSRVQGYRTHMLQDLLYHERSLIDYFDKELCIFPAEEWPNYARIRQMRRSLIRSSDEVTGAREWVLKSLREKGPLCSKDLDRGESVAWFWGNTRLSRAVLEHLFYAGEVGIHHKKGAIKYYEPIERCLPAALHDAGDPHADMQSLQRYMLKRRVGAVGLLWDKASPALLGIPDMKTAARKEVFAALVKEGSLIPLKVEGLKEPLYMLAEDWPLLEGLCEPEDTGRCEFIAPLDPMLWDRKLIQAVFEFDYTWEIYVTPAKRKYGYYVLPVLYNGAFVGRVEPVYDRVSGTMSCKGLWFEPGIRTDKSMKNGIDKALETLADIHISPAAAGS